MIDAKEMQGASKCFWGGPMAQGGGVKAKVKKEGKR